MEWVTLKVEVRDKNGSRNCRRLRAKELVPAVLYGGGKPEENLMIKNRDLHVAVNRRARLVSLVYKDNQERALIKDIQHDPLGERIIHVDFVRLALDQKITLDIEVVLKGKPKGVVTGGGVLEQNLRSVSVSCLPTAMIKNFEVDVSGLDLGELVRVKDLVVSSGVTVLSDPEIVVAGVHMPKVEEEAPLAAEAEAAEPEVITQKKEVSEEDKIEAEKPAKGSVAKQEGKAAKGDSAKSEEKPKK
ncbi:50S ribosomal protein L25 [Planctomycetota bacterium]